MSSKDSDATGTPLAVFGAMLRFYRSQAGLSQIELAARAYVSHDVISKVETGQRVATPELVTALEAVPELDARGARNGPEPRRMAQVQLQQQQWRAVC